VIDELAQAHAGDTVTIAINRGGNPTSVTVPTWSLADRRRATALSQVVPLQRATLGIQVSDQTGANGLLVAGIQASGPAQGSGLYPGVTIIAVDGQPIRTFTDILVATYTHRSGEAVTVTFTNPDGSIGTALITLADGTASAGATTQI
jgi:S1-C subfamily serine protease